MMVYLLMYRNVINLSLFIYLFILFMVPIKRKTNLLQNDENENFPLFNFPTCRFNKPVREIKVKFSISSAIHVPHKLLTGHSAT